MEGTWCSSPYGEELKCLISENDSLVQVLKCPAAECGKADF